LGNIAVSPDLASAVYDNATEVTDIEAGADLGGGRDGDPVLEGEMASDKTWEGRPHLPRRLALSRYPSHQSQPEDVVEFWALQRPSHERSEIRAARVPMKIRSY
jgi:hypothetical protein